MATGWSDERFVELVERLDEQVASVSFDGGVATGFRVTPTTTQPELADALGLKIPLWVKDETGNVAGSHKGRHLFGTMLQYAVDNDEVADGHDQEMAIASCGNAALAAAVVAKANGAPLRVFIPTWADEVIVGQLSELGARIEVCERREGESGDPSFLRFQEAVVGGARPFSVQGPSTPSALDGGRTLGWELADQLKEAGVKGRVRMLMQVGGGALAATTFRAVRSQSRDIEWILHTVQGEACSPLRRAWDLLIEEVAPELVGRNDIKIANALSPELRTRIDDLAHAEPDRFMYPWNPVGDSIATGILDDVTYDWLPVLHQLLAGRGWPIAVPESALLEAHQAALQHTDIDVEPTGTAGLAGLWSADIRADRGRDSGVAFVFSGRSRH